MKKALLLGLFVFAGAFFNTQHVFAMTQGTWSFDVSGHVTSMSEPTNTGVYGYAFLATSTIPNSGTFPLCTGGSSGSGSNFDTGNIVNPSVDLFTQGGLGETNCAAAGTYYMFLTDGTFNVITDYWVLTYDGVNPTPSNPPPDEGDHPELTGVIRYNSPEVYATTTSPYVLDFDGLVNANASTTDGYKITYTSDNGCIRTRYGLLPSYTPGVPFNYSTTTATLQDFCEGALRMTIEFGGGTQDTIQYGTPWYGSGYALGIVFAYNVSEYESSLNYSYTPPPFGGYASTSCALSLNPFAESNFQVADCAGYLFVPQSNQFSAYTSFKDTLMLKFPFSYFASAKGTWDSLQAGSANASPTYSFALHDAGIGSTTAIGNFLPNATVFSASTTKQYFPGNTFDLLKALAAIAIWLTFIGYVFFHTRDILAKS